MAAAVLMNAGPAHAEYQYLNLALNAPVLNVSLNPGVPCSLTSGPEKAVDGKASNIYTDKWCVKWAYPRLQIQLRNPFRPLSIAGFDIDKVVIKHAGAAGENRAYNTRQFVIKASTDGLRWDGVGGSLNNTADVTTQSIYGDKLYRFVELEVLQSTQTDSNVLRIYEIEVWGWAVSY